MEENIKETIVVNKDDLKHEDADQEPEKIPEAEAEPEIEAGSEAEAEPEIEAGSEAEAEPEIEAGLESEEEPEKEEDIPDQHEVKEETEEQTTDKTVVVPADSVPFDDIEYTLLLHEVSDLTIPIPGMKQPEPEGDEGDAEEESADETQDQGSGEAEAGEEQTEETGLGLPEGHSEIGEINERIEARRRYNERKKRRARTRFYVVLTIIALAVFFGVISMSSIFTVDSIEVRGNEHYTAEEIINMGHAVPGHNIIYDLNKQEIEEYLDQNPYIKNAEVKRKLPSTMVIKVRERKEKIAFRYDDDYLIMDEGGILLKKTRNAPRITLIEGLVVNKIKLGEKIGTENNRLMDKGLDIVREMTKADMYFVKIDLSDEKKIKAYIYDTLTVKTDYDMLMTNLKNGRLHLVVEKLFDDGIRRGTITFEEDGSASFMPII